jgi:hypothetical protein
MAGNTFLWTSDSLSPGLAEFGEKLHAAVTTLFAFMEDKAMEYMKSNAPWTDQTGNARNTLSAKSFPDPDEYTLVIYHQMPYGIWLEVRWEGKYAILIPSIEHLGPEIMSALRDIVGRLSSV